jgi:hypothetical protein
MNILVIEASGHLWWKFWLGLSGGAGDWSFLESVKKESTSQIDKTLQSCPWRTSWQLATDFGYTAAAREDHPINIQALASRDAVIKACERLRWTQVGVCSGFIVVEVFVVKLWLHIVLHMHVASSLCQASPLTHIFWLLLASAFHCLSSRSGTSATKRVLSQTLLLDMCLRPVAIWTTCLKM